MKTDKDCGTCRSGSEIAIAAAAAFVALCAFILSLVDHYETRHHDVLSMLPVLTVSGSSSPPVGIVVSNKGAGTAIISRSAVIVDGVLMSGSDGFGGWCDAVKKLGIFGNWIYFDRLDPGDAIGPGQSVALLREEPITAVEHASEIDAARKRIKVLVVYKSVYGEAHTLIYSSKGSIFQDGDAGLFVSATDSAPRSPCME